MLLRDTRGTFQKLIPGDLKWFFLTDLNDPMQKMCGIPLPCQRGKQKSWGVSPSFPWTFSLPAQVSRERSRGEAAGAMPALGAFGSRTSGSFCIHLLWSCQQVKHSVFLRAAETPCALSPPLAELPWPCLAPCLGWGRFNPLGSPNGSLRFGQAWGAVLLHLARGKKPHQLLAIAKTLSTDFGSTAEQWQPWQSDLERSCQSKAWTPPGLHPRFPQGSWDGGCVC